MAIDQQVGTGNIRTNFYDKVIKGFADRVYKFKQAVNISPTSAWNNFFYRESSTVLTEASGLNAIKGVPRGASFPQAVAQWERVQTVIVKFGLEDNIHWEDIVSDDISTQERTLFKIAEGVAKAVDDYIWDTLTESRSVTNIQSITLGTATTGGSWDVSSAAIVDNLMQAKQKIAEYNYPVENLMLFVSPKDHRYMVKYLTDKGAQFPAVSNGLVSGNGVVGTILGIDIVVSNSVTASYALLVVPKRCATYKELTPLTTTTKEDVGKSLTVRAFEAGVCQLTDPNAVVLIKNTQSPSA